MHIGTYCFFEIRIIVKVIGILKSYARFGTGTSFVRVILFFQTRSPP